MGDLDAGAMVPTEVNEASARVHRLRRAPMQHRRRSLLGPMARVGRESDGWADEPIAVSSVDRLRTFGPAIQTIRWGTTGVSTMLVLARGGEGAWFWIGLLILHAAIRTLTPVSDSGDDRSLAVIVLDAAVPVLAVVATQGWSSPLVSTVAIPVAIGGFARGFGFSLRLGVSISAAITVSDVFTAGVDGDESALAIQWISIIGLVAVISAYSRRISGEADRQHDLAVDRLGRLADANALLFSLHRVAQTLPASLDLEEVLDSTMARLRGLFDYDTALVLLFDETDATWHVARREGVQLPDQLGPTDLAEPLKQAIAENSLVHVTNLTAGHVAGVHPATNVGLYTVLPARGSLIGLLALEREEPTSFSERDVELLNGFVEPVALAIDNARWFRRLRTVGADEERTRIARDLHDRIGQSLAYLAFELDRLASADRRGDEIRDSLENLRADVREVIREVRDTLYDLRTDVSDESDLLTVLGSFAERLEQRSGLEIVVTSSASERLPILQEREMWRLAQEAMINVERHADAKRIEVLWRYGDGHAELQVIDDGRGFGVGDGRVDSYGILGMRERAASIGATLEISSVPGAGTTVRCVLR